MSARLRCSVEGCAQQFVNTFEGRRNQEQHEKTPHGACLCGWVGLAANISNHVGQALRHTHGGEHGPADLPPSGPVAGGPRAQVGMRLDPALHARLTAAAEERGVTLGWLCQRLLSEAVDALVPADEIVWTTLGSTTGSEGAG